MYILYTLNTLIFMLLLINKFCNEVLFWYCFISTLHYMLLTALWYLTESKTKYINVNNTTYKFNSFCKLKKVAKLLQLYTIFIK